MGRLVSGPHVTMPSLKMLGMQQCWCLPVAGEAVGWKCVVPTGPRLW
jgi:hypothetical protein